MARADKFAHSWAADLSAETLDTIRKGLVSRITRWPTGGASASELADELMLHAVVDPVATAINDASQYPAG